MAYKFEDKFVHFRWSDSLRGKKVFYGDNLLTLENDALSGNTNLMGIVEGGHDKVTPFIVNDDYWKFVYYDPNYECKKAYDEGKTIQVSGDGEIWVDWEDDRTPDWDSAFQFRIKSESTYCVVVGSNLHLVATEKPFVKESTHVFYESASLKDCTDWINDRCDIENVIIAYAEGKAVEFLNIGDIWCPASTPEWKIGTKYRIKPKEYRAFKNTDELKKKWAELCPTNIHRPSLCEPLIWVKCKSNKSTSVISKFADGNVAMNVLLFYSLEELFDDFTFLDGTPCGIEE